MNYHCRTLLDDSLPTKHHIIRLQRTNLKVFLSDWQSVPYSTIPSERWLVHKRIETAGSYELFARPFKTREKTENSLEPVSSDVVREPAFASHISDQIVERVVETWIVGLSGLDSKHHHLPTSEKYPCRGGGV